MPTVTIEPNEKYCRVVDPVERVHGEDTDFEDWTEEEQEAADSYLETVGNSPTAEDLIVAEEDDDDVVAGCPYCSRSWRMEVRFGDVEQAKSDIRSRVEAHLPCDNSQALSWGDFSVSNDPDLVKKMATYFDGMASTEPTDLLRAKLRLVDCEVYANTQMAARAELDN